MTRTPGKHQPLLHVATVSSSTTTNTSSGTESTRESSLSNNQTSSRHLAQENNDDDSIRSDHDSPLHSPNNNIPPPPAPPCTPRTNNTTHKDCAIFMEGLPRDFTHHPQLAALASLMDEEHDAECDHNNIPIANPPSTQNHSLPTVLNKGGGKSQRMRQRQLEQPYTTTTRHSTTHRSSSNHSATVGEAQLFLKLWNLKE